MQKTEKCAINLSIDAALLDEARRLNINISETLEHHLHGLVRMLHEKRWQEENRDAITSINGFVDDHGLLADHLRLRRARE